MLTGRSLKTIISICKKKVTPENFKKLQEYFIYAVFKALLIARSTTGIARIFTILSDEKFYVNKKM